MKILVLIFNFITVLSSLAFIEDTEWNLFKKTFNKTYDNDDVEFHRYSIWKNASRIVDEHNRKVAKGLITYSLGLNSDSDLVIYFFCFFF
jgi:hypothetical protein